MSGIKYWVWLSSVLASPKSKALMLERYDMDPMKAYFAPEGDFKTIEGVSAGDAEKFEAREIFRAEEILRDCHRQGIEILTMQDAGYPNRLRNIFAPPCVLYVKGRLPVIDEEAAIAVIGTRKPSFYGEKMGRNMGYEITKCGGLVVSGLTVGIDAAGARGALLAGGRPVGVLGVPHECVKGQLYEDTAVLGALVSEYAPGTTPLRSFFRDRNRITAGLSVGVVVVEAPEKSGTRLFADEAAEQGKEIFAVPGNADNESCAGSNELLKQGAKPVTNGWDILCEFEGLYPDKIHRDNKKPPVYSESAADCDEKILQQNDRLRVASPKKVIDKTESADYIDLQAQLKNLSDEQLSIVSAISEPATHVDDIIERTGLSPAKTLAGLTILQLKGFVKQESGKRFTLNIKMK